MSKDKSDFKGLTRRELLKGSSAVLGGFALGGILGACNSASAQEQQKAIYDHDPCYPTERSKRERYSYFDALDGFNPKTPVEPNEMRITFMGSAIPTTSRRVQQMMSIFVQVGNAMGEEDQFIFDCGSGVVSNYGALGVPFSKMDKIFVTHLHGDHISDITHIYCFGNSGDRKSPLYVWGNGPTGQESPLGSGRYYEDGTRAYCHHLREALRWHTESQSFQANSYRSFQPPTKESWGLPVDPVPVGEDSPDDAYAIVPIELDWRKYGAKADDNVAYYNPKSGVKITHFPVIHCRKGSMGYKLEWNGLSMIYTGDTKPETQCITQAMNNGKGVDVFIHEMIVPAEIWAMLALGLDQPGSGPGWDKAVSNVKAIQNSSHTPQGAFGYLISQIEPRPRLTVATHFPVSDDTVECALKSVRTHVPDIVWDPVLDPVHRNITWSFDRMVIRVTPSDIRQVRADVSDFSLYPPNVARHDDYNQPKYHDKDGNPDPYAQIDRSTEILPGENTFCEDGY